jgi:hypothetical protein
MNDILELVFDEWVFEYPHVNDKAYKEVVDHLNKQKALDNRIIFITTTYYNEEPFFKELE